MHVHVHGLGPKGILEGEQDMEWIGKSKADVNKNQTLLSNTKLIPNIQNRRSGTIFFFKTNYQNTFLVKFALYGYLRIFQFRVYKYPQNYLF